MKSDLVDTFFKLGLSTSYYRVLVISTCMGNNACHHLEAKNVVCPLKLWDGLFTSAAINTTNHNPSSTTATDSFHGTSISLFQHASTQVEGFITEEDYTLTSEVLYNCPTIYLEENQCFHFCHKW